MAPCHRARADTSVFGRPRRPVGPGAPAGTWTASSAHARPRPVRIGRLCVTLAVAVASACAAGSRPAGPDGEIIARFRGYNDARLALPVAQLRQAIEAMDERAGPHDAAQITRLVGDVNISRVEGYLSRAQRSALPACLEHPGCGAYALLTMQSWAKVQIVPLRVQHEAGADRARLFYRGVDDDGRAGDGYADFVREDRRWQVDFESFGGAADACSGPFGQAQPGTSPTGSFNRR